MNAIRHFEAINHATGETSPATIYQHDDGSLVAYADEDVNMESPLGTASADQGADALENSLE